MPVEPNRPFTRSPALVALAAWILPGAGYLLLNQRARGLTVGVTIIVLFILGLLIGGVRCLEVPGFNAHGAKVYSYTVKEDRKGQSVAVEHITDKPITPGESSNILDSGWVLEKHPLNEIRSKPWSIAQVMVGPMNLLADWWAIRVANEPFDPQDPSKGPLGARSHSRTNELGVLYAAVAGMLNLLAIIDSSHRAGRSEENE
jgi:uncharacterized protein DUF6677